LRWSAAGGCLEESPSPLEAEVLIELFAAARQARTGDAGPADPGAVTASSPCLASATARWEPSSGSDWPALPRGTRLEGNELCILDAIDQGGMGAVYLAWHEILQCEVAVKVSQEPAMEARFRTEIELQNRLGGHPHLVAVKTAGRHAGRYYLVMEYVAGIDLKRIVEQHGPLSPRVAIDLVRQAALGLEHAHRRGLVHRDIKPSNLILSQADGMVKVLDWGLARRLDPGAAAGDSARTRLGDLLGTPDYMSPEQFDDPSRVGIAGDLYSLGCTFYRLLAGRPPFAAARTLAAKLRAHEQEPPPSLPVELGVPAAVERVVCTLLAKRPEDRYGSASELITALDQALDEPSLVPETAQPAPALPDPPPPLGLRKQDLPPPVSLRSWLSRRGGLAALTLLGVLVVVGFGVLSPRRHYSPRPRAAHESGQVLLAPGPLIGAIDVRIWHPDNPRRQHLSLSDPGAMPLQHGDQIRIEAVVNRPAYLYIIWIDSEGVPQPVYPWKPGEWGRPAGPEKPVDHLQLPEVADGVVKGWNVKGWKVQGPPGMETLILLARESPLPAEVDLRELFSGLPRQAVQEPRALVWFADWKLVRREDEHKDEHVRGPQFFDPQAIEDPVLQTETLLRQRLSRYFAMMRAVSFANRGH
jgi:serine/threonine protein kinase